MNKIHAAPGVDKIRLLAPGLCLALILLFALPAAAQDLTAARFRVGMAAMQLATHAKPDKREELLDKAIAAFRTILVKRPELVRVRLELARAFFLKEEDRLARRHFELVLAGKPPAGVALNVNRFLSVMRARKRWSLRLGAAVAPDTNIGAGSDERIVYSPAPSSYPLRRPAIALPPRPGGTHHLGHRRLRLAWRGIPAAAGRVRDRARGEPVAAARRRQSRARSTGRANSTR